MLRNIVIFSLFDPNLRSDEDDTLNCAIGLLKDSAGAKRECAQSDIFFLIVCTNESWEEIDAFMFRNGLTEDQIEIIRPDDEEVDFEDYEALCVLVGERVSRWLEQNHPASLVSLPKRQYSSLQIWFHGIESIDEDFPWPFEVNEYAYELPDTHKTKAATWLTILKEAMEFGKSEDEWDKNQLSVYAATLCEWLHGFEAVSENDFDYFEPSSVIQSLKISDFYLGYFAGQLGTEDLVEGDPDEIKADALKKATERHRNEIRNALSHYFGGDSSLFWTLYSSIWPHYFDPCEEAFSSLVSPVLYCQIEERGELFEYVSAG